MELCFRYLEIQLVKKRKKEHSERMRFRPDDNRIRGGRGSAGWSYARAERPTSPRPSPPPPLNRRPPPEAQIR